MTSIISTLVWLRWAKNNESIVITLVHSLFCYQESGISRELTPQLKGTNSIGYSKEVQ